jgi:hypothetical protein
LTPRVVFARGPQNGWRRNRRTAARPDLELRDRPYLELRDRPSLEL